MGQPEDPIVDRLGLEVLSPEACWAFVSDASLGRLAFVHEGVPQVLPVTHKVTGARIVFRSVKGTKLGAATMAPSVAFEVDAWDPLERTGWSVLARGVAESSPLDADDLEDLGLESLLPSADTWVAIRVDEITGRRLGHAHQDE